VSQGSGREEAPPFDRTANVLGAFSLVVADRMNDAISEAGGHPSTAAALSALYHFLDGPSVDRLRQVLGLTSSGTVRLVDRLEHEGYVVRRPGADGRSTAVTLTPAGRRLARKVAAARAGVLAGVLGVLTDDERTTLDTLLSRLLVSMIRGPGATRWICRLCDTVACGHAAEECPIARATAGARRLQVSGGG